MLQKEKGSLERKFISVEKMLMKGLRLVHCDYPCPPLSLSSSLKLSESGGHGYQQLLLIDLSFQAKVECGFLDTSEQIAGSTSILTGVDEQLVLSGFRPLLS